jgi:hypothetical protein
MGQPASVRLNRRTRQQLLDAAKAADEARAQVVKALREARTAWRQIRNQSARG